MTVELSMLFWAVVLTVVQMLVAVQLFNMQVGLAALAGNRDGSAPEGMAGRASRAHRNMLENLPLFAALVLVVQLGGLNSDLTALGAQIFVIARLVYGVIYIIGVPWLRTATWFVSAIGMVMMAWTILAG
ncbi:MAG: MAPEG family protein [Alphaproteobacteria bacterium]|nr:MAPEG family protein [Alphaproteobacteria bacterium]